jgi:DNA (cytosine-5)-methyltransferase 1
MKVLDLFSGIGGFSLGLEWAGFETAAFCEFDQEAQKVLRKNWPEVPIFSDVRTLTKQELQSNGIYDIRLICGGYPCQPFSLAGERRGAEDDRHLWPEMFRLIQELRPDWVIGENVAGHINMGLDEVLADLEAAGYTARPFVIPACAVDAHHRRDRAWIVAHANSDSKSDGSKHEQRMVENTSSRPRRDSESITGRQNNEAERSQDTDKTARPSKDVACSNGAQCQRNSSAIRTSSKYSDTSRSSWWKPEPNVGRVANGVPRRSHRLKQLGNAVVPQVVEKIGQMIMKIERGEEDGTNNNRNT